MDLRALRSLFVVLTVVIPSLVCAAEWKRSADSGTKQKQGKQKQVSQKVTDATRNKGRELYKALMAMRKETDFIENGYGHSGNRGRYGSWDRDVSDLSDQCSNELQKLSIEEKLKSGLLDVCTATTNLRQLGMHYAMNGAVDDRSTQTWKSAIRTAFKIK